ncbi:response regulator transcription factor [Aeromicrobium sp. 179-A 4D2 NHS]|uniref:helix-turn-helix transcriptional regulator n=1 Tax=Aeromicrobium sp. 179-A 4D2 NHS TaxID=3142375 RepID=UPI0039A21C5C
MLDSPSVDEMTEITDSSDSLQDRVDAFVSALRCGMAYDAAWLTVSDPRLRDHAVVGSAGLDEEVADFLASPETADEITAGGADGLDPFVRLSELPGELVDRPVWTRCLGPAGFLGGLGATVRDGSGQQVGFIGLLNRHDRPPHVRARPHLEQLAPLISHGLSPMRSLLAAARMVPDAEAGVVLMRDGSTCTLPGMHDHPLLHRSSPAVRVAHGSLAVGQVSQSFLWPAGAADEDAGHVRLTVLATTEMSRFVGGLLLLSPTADCHALTPRELQVLGLLVNGRSNQQIATTLAVTPRTVATHVEHVMRKLHAPSRTSAAVQAEREGLYVPPWPRRHGPR